MKVTEKKPKNIAIYCVPMRLGSTPSLGAVAKLRLLALSYPGIARYNGKIYSLQYYADALRAARVEISVAFLFHRSRKCASFNC